MTRQSDKSNYILKFEIKNADLFGEVKYLNIDW